MDTNKTPIIGIQNRNYSEQDDKKTLNALANLGQRTGLKGDGVGYRYFTLADLFDNKFGDVKNPYGVLYYNNNKATFGVIDKNDPKLVYVNAPKPAVPGIEPYNKVVSTQNAKASNIPINNIEYLAPGNKFYIDRTTNTITSTAMSKIAGMLDSEENNLELLYNRFNLNNHKLEKYVRIFHLADVFNNKFYCFVKLEQNKLSIQVFDLLKVDPTYYIDEVIQRFSLNGKAQLNESKLYDTEDFSGNLSADMMKLFETLCTLTPDNKKYGLVGVACAYNADGKLSYSVDDLKLKDKIVALDGFLSQYMPSLHVSRIIDYINTSIEKNYEFTLTSINNSIYGATKQNLSKAILQSIYETLHTPEINKHIDNYTKVLYVPLDYKFYYICNSNNTNDIYYSNDIYIRQIGITKVGANEKEIDDRNLNTLKKNLKSGGIFYYGYENKTEVYSFSIDYNTRFNSLINFVNIAQLFTLPYIKDEQWTINNINTGVNAVGRDAGMPHLIFASYINSEFKIINNNSRFDFLDTTIPDNLTTVKLRFADLDDSVIVKVPKAYEDYHSVFRDAIMLLYIEFTNRFGQKRFVTTIWEYIINNNGEWSFSNVKDKSKPKTPTEEYPPMELGNNILVEQASNARQLRLDANTGSKEKNTVYDPRDKSTLELATYGNLNFKIVYKPEGELEKVPKYLSNIAVSSTEYKYINKDKGVENNKPIITVISDKADTELYRDDHVSYKDEPNALIWRTYIAERPVTGTTSSTTQNLPKYTNYTPDVTYSESQEEYFKEYVFKNNVPTFNCAELFLRDVNALNRYNIVSLDSLGHMYNAYIGTNWNTDSKREFIIGTSSENINLGRATLSDYKMAEVFYKHDSLTLDFPLIRTKSDATYLNGPVTVYDNKYNSVSLMTIDGKCSEQKIGHLQDIKSSIGTNKSIRVGMRPVVSLKDINVTSENLFIDIKDTPQVEKSSLNAVYIEERLKTKSLYDLNGAQLVRKENVECPVETEIPMSTDETIDLADRLSITDDATKSIICLYIEKYNFETDCWELYKDTYSAHKVAFNEQGIYRICAWTKLYITDKQKTIYVKVIGNDKNPARVCTLLHINKLLKQTAGLDLNKLNAKVTVLNIKNKDKRVLNQGNDIFLICNSNKINISNDNARYNSNLTVKWYIETNKDEEEEVLLEILDI